MIAEKEFYQELGRVPEVPHNLYENVRRKIRRQTLFLRTVLALAATVIIAVGAGGVLVAHKETVRNLSPEVAEDLQIMHNYLTGKDLDLESESYALYEEVKVE